MSWFGIGADKAIDAVGNTVEKTGNALDKLFTSDGERLTHSEIMERIKQQPQAWAHELNLINARDRSWFNSGWRPAIGWVGAIGMAAFFIPQFFMATIVWVRACWAVMDGYVAGQVLSLPAYPVSDAGLWELVALLIGGKVVRTIEKRDGVAR